MKSFRQYAGVKEKSITENSVRYEALTAMKEIQSSIANISLLGVLGAMRDTNPLRKEILDMEAKLHDLSAEMGQFIADNIADVETEDGEKADVEPEEKPEKEDKPEKEEKPSVQVNKKEPEEEVTESCKIKNGDYLGFKYRGMELGGTVIEVIKDSDGDKSYKMQFDTKIDPYLAKRFENGNEPVVRGFAIKTHNGKEL